jgi:hypothetical protein
MYKLSHLSFPRARRLYGIESLHLPRHFVTPAVRGNIIQEGHHVITFAFFHKQTALLSRTDGTFCAGYATVTPVVNERKS